MEVKDFKQNVQSENEIRQTADASSLVEISIIETMSGYLEQNGGVDINSQVLQGIAEALSKKLENASRGTLQDITMDNTNIFVPRSPNHKSPPMLGRSVRELEEKISVLQKENFNLKLRMYFITESTPELKACTENDSNSPEALIKQLIDKKVEVESLKKEVKEKQDVLRDAAAAITQLEDLQKETEEKYGQTIKDLEAQLRRLEAQQSHVRTHADDDSNFHVYKTMLADAEERIKDLNTKLKAQELKVNALEQRLSEQTLQQDQLHEALEEKDRQLNEARMNVNQNSSTPAPLNQTIEIKSLKAELADVTCELQESQEKLNEQMKIHKEACRTIQRLMQIIVDKQDIKCAGTKKKQQTQQQQQQQQHEDRLEASGSSLDAITETERERYENVIAEQQSIIQRLEEDVKKGKADFQALVNSDLWEKNRDVKWLTDVTNTSDSKLKTDDANQSIDDPKQTFTDTDYAKAIEKNKVLQQRLNVLIRRIIADQHNEAVIVQLRKELEMAQTDTENAEKWRRECADVCAILTNRLEELAGFLNSLLKQKDVLGILAADRRSAMKRAVNRSMDLSRNLSMTLSISRLSIADQSIAQICNISELLNNIEAEEKLFCTDEDCREQRKTPMKDNDRRRSSDVRKERRSMPLLNMQQQQQYNNQSESEAWSEPDRNVSLARIGLEDTSSSLAKELPASKRHGTDSDSESNSDVGTNAKHEQQLLTERFAQLEKLLKQRDKRINDIKSELDDTKAMYLAEKLRAEELVDQLHELKNINEQVSTNELKMKSELTELQETLEAKVREIQKVRQDFIELQEKYEAALTSYETEKIAMKQEFDERLATKEREYNELFARDYISISTHDHLKRQLTELQHQFKEAQRTIDNQIENEQDLKLSLLDSERAARELKRQLDGNTLNASRIIAERTKAYTEKLQLELRVQQLSEELTQLHAQTKLKYAKLSITKLRTNSVASDTAPSGYTSEEIPLAESAENVNAAIDNIEAKMQRSNNNSSPDLGIESDNGRLSSNEKCDNNGNNCLDSPEIESDNNGENIEVVNAQIEVGEVQQQPLHDCIQVEKEKEELRRKLARTKRTLEDTYEKLRAANKQKEQIEKEIRTQILKTHSVLKDVRTNMETDL